MCGFATNRGELIAFRFLSGLGGSAALAVSLAVLAVLPKLADPYKFRPAALSLVTCGRQSNVVKP